MRSRLFGFSIALAVFLADQLAKIKSMVTVNTSPVGQALVAGRLLESRLPDQNQAHIRFFPVGQP